MSKAAELCIAILICLLAGFYVLYGSTTSYCVAAATLAFCLYWIRGVNRRLYGCFEIAAGLFALYWNSDKGRGPFSTAFSDDFPHFQWELAILTTLGAVYVIVRGLDNVDTELRIRRAVLRAYELVRSSVRLRH